MGSFCEITGQRFGRLVAMGTAGRNRHHQLLWRWRCDCGIELDRTFQPIKEGRVKSCGCHKRDQSIARAKHGKSATRTYRAWIEMKARVRGKDDVCKKHYTERGIVVCDRWQIFENFFADMGECPRGLSIDRIDNDGNYEPGNCRWATQRDQLANTRRTVRIIVNGEERCLKHACQEAGINYDGVQSRIRLGATPQEAFDRGPMRHRRTPSR